jgi:hypothetical protein
MACPTRAELSQLHDGELASDRAREVRAHLRECPEGRAWVRTQTRLDAATQGRTPTARCLTAAELSDLVEGVADDELQRWAGRHARSCGHCKEAWTGLNAARGAAAAPARARTVRVAYPVAWSLAAAAAAVLLVVAFWPSRTLQAPGQRGAEVATLPPAHSTENVAPSSNTGESAVTHEAPPQATPAETSPAKAEPEAAPAQTRSPRGHGRQQATGERRETTPAAKSLPELPVMALTGTSPLVQRWQETGGSAKFTRNELEELHRELRGDRRVLEALIGATEAELRASKSPRAEEALKHYRRELAALEPAEPRATSPAGDAPQTTGNSGASETKTPPAATPDKPQDAEPQTTPGAAQ